MALLIEELIKSIEVWLRIAKKQQQQQPRNAVDENGREESVWVRILGADHEFRDMLWSKFDSATVMKWLYAICFQATSAGLKEQEAINFLEKKMNDTAFSYDETVQLLTSLIVFQYLFFYSMQDVDAKVERPIEDTPMEGEQQQEVIEIN